MSKPTCIALIFFGLTSIYNLSEANSNTITCDGKTDDTVAIQHSVNNYKNIALPKGKCVVTRSIIVSSKVNIYGESANDSLILQLGSPPEANSLFTFFEKSSGSTLKNITLQGLSSTRELTEHQHLIKILGASNIDLEGNIFKSFRGDGIYIGKNKSSINQDINISENLFDGVNNNNRNAISIITGKNIKILNNVFKNTTKQNMPGAIDIEPNSNSDEIENIIITDNKFYNIGGYSAISIYFTRKTRIKPSNYVIANNIINTLDNTKSIAFRDVGRAFNRPEWKQLYIHNNKLSSSHNDTLYIQGINYDKSNIKNNDIHK